MSAFRVAAVALSVTTGWGATVARLLAFAVGIGLTAGVGVPGGATVGLGALALGAAATTPARDSGVIGMSPNQIPATASAKARSIVERRMVRLDGDALGLTVARTIPRGPRGYHHPVTQGPTPAGAAQLLRSVGLLADGPAQWGRPVPGHRAGVFVIELSAPLPAAPVELTRVGKWIERVDSLRLDGDRPTSRMLAARLSSFWLPTQTVLYIGTSEVSIGRRLAGIVQTELGDRRPYAGGHWLKTLRNLASLKVWWSPTTATEEYEDALFDAFAATVPEADQATLPDRAVVLPFGNLRRADGQRKATGITGPLLAEPSVTPAPPTRVVQLPDGDAEGADGEPPQPRGRRAASGPAARSNAPSRARTRSVAPTPATEVAREALTADGETRLRAELDRLTTVRRPEVIARIRTAKEHGDLRENAEYHAAREEQSFLEGRVQALEARLRTAVIVDAPVDGGRVGLGSRVTVEADGETVTYTIVGASESDPTAGRISSSSPVGRALVGRDVGDTVAVRTPAGEQQYRIVEVR